MFLCCCVSNLSVSRARPHRSVDPSASTILQPRVRIPSTTSMLFKIVFELSCEKYEKINKKRPSLAHDKNLEISLLKYAFDAYHTPLDYSGAQ